MFLEKKCNEVKHIVVGGIVPRTKKNTEKYNKELNSICRQENIDFVNHSENFLLKNVVPFLVKCTPSE
jgi:hypothetical protein